MRVTLTIDDDVLAAARVLAAHQRRSLGEIISELSRKSLLADAAAAPATRDGMALFQRQMGSTWATMELVNQLRDETGC